MAYDYEYFKKAVYDLTKIDLNAYKEKQMKRRIDTLISKNKIVGYDKYIAAIKSDNKMFEEFVNYLTINVSEFYRNPDQWELLDKDIFPDLIKRYGRNLKIWSAACSTGDEPYTIAMILSEYVPLSKIRIIASDLDEDVLAFAKDGIYPAKSLSDLPKKYLDKHFKKVDESHYAISPEIKKCVEFKKHNLLKDRYFQHVHMIVCRNVVIYFTDEAKDQVYENFHSSLVDDGILFIGSTEQILHAKELGFESMRTFFYKKMKI